jgi:hypothetical protein
MQQWLHVAKRRQSAIPEATVPAAAVNARRRWLLLAHQLPATPSNLRVRTWRRLQELGAIPVKQTVYALPDSAESREDFEWLRVEIEGSGGEAVIFAAEHLSVEAEAALVEEFRRHRQAAYTELAAEVQRFRPKKAAGRNQRPLRDVARYRARFQAIERIDFFGSAGRDRVASLLAALESNRPDAVREGSSSESDDSKQFQGRRWVTRPRPGVDRMASAWLIRRFIDQAATFDFVTDAKSAPARSVPFDMYGVGYGHEGEHCTFEVLVRRFGIRDNAVQRLAEVVHDLDLKDGKFGAPAAMTLGAAIDGLQLSCVDDHRLLEQGIILFEAMYRSFARQASSPRPRAVARSRRAAR